MSNEQLIALAIQNLPAAIDLLKSAFKRENPEADELTNEAVIGAWKSACDSSLAKDDAWLAAHPGPHEEPSDTQ